MSVLVVEDHDFQRRTALTLLRGLGVGALDEAADGHAALELLAGSTPPDVIICDIDMPGMDGVEFIRQVAARGLASAVVIASGLEARLLRAVRSVCEGYGLQVLGAVEKPLTMRRLSELLSAYRRPAPAEPGRQRVAVSGRALAEALDAGAIVADFQPIVDLASGRVSGAQSVARWEHAGPIADADLLPVLEAEGLTGRFVDRILALVCDELHTLARAGLDVELWIAIPVDALGDARLAERLVDVVRANGADPQRIVCAIDAYVLRADRPAALDVLTRLRVKGFGLCIDAFAPAQAAAEQIERFPFTAVRLDARLVAGAASDPARVTELQDAIDLARAQDLVVVGGGCSSAADFELLLQLGCGHGQGAFIGDPIPAPELAAWAARWRPPLADGMR